MQFSTSLMVLAISAGTAIADCTWPYCYVAGRYYYACEDVSDCQKLGLDTCQTGLESPTPSGSLCSPWPVAIMANFTYVTTSCIYPYCFNVQGHHTYGCTTNADCVAHALTTCKTGDVYALGFLPGRCYA